MVRLPAGAYVIFNFAQRSGRHTTDNIKEGRKMKKRYLNIGIIIFVLMFAAGCSQQQANVSMDVDSVADGIMKAVTFKDQMSEVKEKTALTIYGLDAASVTKAKVYESTGATAEEVAVFEGKDEKAAGTVKEAVQKRVETQKESYKDYVPAELEKLKKPLIIEKGRYVVLCVADDTSPAQKVVDSAAK
jgi:hypothetical protein